MRILIVNYRYFVSGGPEKYMFNITEMLRAEGHEVIPFSVHSNRNIETEYEPYFVDPIGDRDSTYYEDYKKTPKTIVQLLSRSIYSPEVKRAVKRIIADTNPDIVYVLHFVNKLSPSVLAGAKEMGKPVIVRLSDYFLLCPRFDFMYDNVACEECLTMGYRQCIKKKCVKHSFFASFVRVMAMKIQNSMNIFRNADLFVCPSQFLCDKLTENGFFPDKIRKLTTFTPDVEYSCEHPGDYGLYFGRLSEEKGLESLLAAYRLLGPQYNLHIVGDDSAAEAQRLKRIVSETGMQNIKFMGFKSGDDLLEEVRGARYVCMPALWYENVPNSVLEAFAAAKPVISSRIGSLIELVEDGYNGLLSEPNDPDSIAECIRKLDSDEIAVRLGRGARESFEQHYTADKHFGILTGIFNEYISAGQISSTQT